MPQKHSRPSASSVALFTALFIVAIIALGGLATNVIETMRSSADTHDDERAFRAAQSAVRSLKDRVSTILLNNAGLADAYDASQTDKLADWASSNWGREGTYSLYDGAIVTTKADITAMATYKGRAFDPHTRFPKSLRPQVTIAMNAAGSPVVEFVKTWDGVDVLASAAIRPHAYDTNAKSFAILSLYRHVRDSDLGLLAEQYQLAGLRLFPRPPANMLFVPLRDLSGNAVAYLGWKRLLPGTRVYNDVGGKLAAAGVILVLFLAVVVLAGSVESRRLTKMARSARYEANHDGLSGLLNRAGLLAELQQNLADARPVTLHMLDLDGFKAVNDIWGHQIGDALIKKVADGISVSHPEISAAARLGGDEFALIQQGESSQKDFSDRILSVFGRTFEIESRTVEVGASMGSASSDHVSDPFELLRRADMALYRAKEDGKGRAIAYHADLDRDREGLMLLEDELRHALAESSLTVAYQPLVAANTGRLNGVEALARWRHATGNISPEVFIPLAERSGLIDELGLFVLRQSVRTVSVWPDLNLSVNVSPVQICSSSFANRVANLLIEENFEPTRLTLEITEGVLMSNPTQAQKAISDLKKIGIRFSLDDFGCGYASIGALRQFGFNSMKIDRSLVQEAAEGCGKDVLKATVALAAALSIPVTAEGIETVDQAELMRDAGCDQLQGYLLGRPMSHAELSDYIDAKCAMSAALAALAS